ncbi:MAG TPA: hypothetical protein VFS60_13100 [Thermoanaerobaculia bacterium]|nr:hypothetical protein [Thermoanaerobaculia bacterium]
MSSRIILRGFISGVLFLAVTAALPAQQLSKNGRPAAAPFGPPHVDVIGATSITQSTNPTTVTTGSSVSCNNGAAGGFLHTDNSYFRAFTLSAFNPPLDQLQFMVQSITFGIEQSNASGTGTTQPITVRIHSSTTNPPTNASMTLLSTQVVNVPDQANTTITVPLTTQPVFLTATGILVVEIFSPDGQTAGHSFFIGSNALGQSGPSFIRAASCGISEVTNLASIGFANMHIVMTVNGNSQAPVSLESVTVE